MINSLFTNTGELICPQCEKAQNVLAYTRLKQLKNELTSPILKCKECRFVFAPKV